MANFWEKYKTRVENNFMGSFDLTDGIEFWRNKLFFTIIVYLLPLSLILLLPSIIMTYFMNLLGLAVSYFVFALFITFIALYRNINIASRKYSFLGLLYLVASALIFFMGEHGAGITYLFGVTVFALLILPVKAGKITIVINIAICLLHAAFISYGFVDYPLRENFEVLSWLLISGNSILLSIMAVIFMPMILSGLQNTIIEQLKLEKQLRLNQQELQESLDEKETLLAEVHHRVKNNLAVISGMLLLQSFKEKDEKMQKKLLDSTLRIKSMAKIHEQLYQSKSFSQISFNEGLENLVETIIDTMDGNKTFSTVFDLQPVQLSINQAIPCSLIVNEVITNSIKHGYPDQQKGTIKTTLLRSEDNITLQIEDDGVGFNGKQAEPDTSLGMELISTLSKQLEADYMYENRPDATGAVFKITFTIKDSSSNN